MDGAAGTLDLAGKEERNEDVDALKSDNEIVAKLWLFETYSDLPRLTHA